MAATKDGDDHQHRRCQQTVQDHAEKNSVSVHVGVRSRRVQRDRTIQTPRRYMVLYIVHVSVLRYYSTVNTVPVCVHIGMRNYIFEPIRPTC